MMEKFLAAIRLRLESELAAEDYRRWVKPLSWEYNASEQSLIISAPTIFHQKKIAEEYLRLIIGEAAAQGLSPPMQFKLRSLPRDIAKSQPVINLKCAWERSPALSGLRIDPERGFDSFIVYPSNRLTVLALEAFTRGYEILPAKMIFLSAAGSWGKSHLLDAVTQRLAGKGNVLRLEAADPEERQWAEANVIIADDAHLLEQRPEIQNRLIRAFDESFSRPVRIIASARSTIFKLKNINDQLRSRLSGGLHLKIEPPEFELMMDLAGRKAQKVGLEINQEKRGILAKAAQSDPRRLSGFIDSIKFISANTELSQQEILDAIITDKNPGEGSVILTVDFIIETVAASFALKPHDLTGHNKLRQTAWPRRAAMCLTRELTGLTTSEIGKAFGGRDHSTVIHALKKINEEVKNPANARIVENIRRTIIIGTKETPEVKI